MKLDASTTIIPEVSPFSRMIRTVSEKGISKFPERNVRSLPYSRRKISYRIHAVVDFPSVPVTVMIEKPAGRYRWAKSSSERIFPPEYARFLGGTPGVGITAQNALESNSSSASSFCSIEIPSDRARATHASPTRAFP